jgi:hypothetical protein
MGKVHNTNVAVRKVGTAWWILGLLRILNLESTKCWKKQMRAKWIWDVLLDHYEGWEINGTLVNNKGMHTPPNEKEAKARTNKQHMTSLSFLPWLTISTHTLYLGLSVNGYHIQHTIFQWFLHPKSLHSLSIAKSQYSSPRSPSMERLLYCTGPLASKKYG